MKLLKLLLSLTIALTAIVGDYIVFKSEISSRYPIFRAFSDTALHGAIGCLSAVLFFYDDQALTNEAYFYNILFCTFISSFIDIDHVFVARSINLKDLTSQKQRGIYHCTTFGLLITTALLIYSYLYRKLNLYIITWMLIIAFTSHHLRDADRRGLWLYPFGHTPPLSKGVYVFMVSILPFMFSILYTSLKPDTYRHTVINYSMLV